MKKDCLQSASISLWCTRLVHIGITIGISSILLIKETVLHEMLKKGLLFLPICYIVVTILSMVLYFIVACMDPGFVKLGDADVKEIRLIIDDEDEESVSLYDSKQGNSNDFEIDMQQVNSREPSEKTKMLKNGTSRCFNLEPHQRCGLCGLERPIRARHCRDCKRCVRKFDHHCPWITNCVGERNHKWFWLFLLYEQLLLAWSIYISSTGYKTSSDNWVSQNIILLIADIAMGILTLMVFSLFLIHSYMLVNNHTTWETMSRHRISYLKGLEDSANPFDLGICRNIMTFFCYFKPYDWTVAYSKSKHKCTAKMEYLHHEVLDNSSDELSEVLDDQT